MCFNISYIFKEEDQQPLKLLCPPCKLVCKNQQDCILCDNCHNWFHFQCTKLSRRAFDQFCQNESLLFICQICKTKTQKKCKICGERHTSEKITLYCVGCLNSFCTCCLPLTDSQVYDFLNTEKTYFCNECSIDHYCGVCSSVCNDGCIMCDSCCMWIHFKCSKLTKKQIRRYQRKHSDVYYCRYCIAQNLPLCSVSSNKLNSLYSNDNLLVSNENTNELTPITAYGAANTQNDCNLCIECNTECAYCIDRFCPDQQRVCEMCLHCDYTQIRELCTNIENYSIAHKDSLTFLHFNIRSHVLYFDSLENTIKRINPEVDVIGLCETRLHRDFNLKKVEIDGYHEFVPTHSNLVCGGTGLYISKKVLCFRRSDLEFDIESCETTIVEIKSAYKQSKNTIVAVIYRHPHQNYESFFTKLSSFVQKVSSMYHVVILGDINIDTSIPSSNSYSKNYKDILLSLGLRNLISKPTRITNSTETILDHVLTNLNFESCQSGILINDMTDHLPIYAFCNLSVCKLKYRDGQKYRTIFKESKKVEFLSTFRNMSQTLKQDIEGSDFDPDIYFVRLVNIITESVEKVFPVSKISNKYQKRFRKPWMTQGILNASDEKHRLYYIYLKSKKDPVKYQNYQRHQTALTRVIENAKSMQMINDFDECAGDSTKTWKVINRYLKKSKGKSEEIISLKNENGSIISDPKTVANKLNSHFVNKRINLASKLPPSQISIFKSMGSRVSNTIQSTSTSTDEVAKFIKELQTNKAYEGLSPKAIKWLEEELTPILTKLFNKFLDDGKYPLCCKVARVTALFKNGDKQIDDNYRPISILSQLNKVFEKIIHSRLNTFISENKLLTPLQYGFRKGHNTSHGITNLNETIIRNLEKKRVICAALFIDLKSAFDTIDPTILIKKLDHIGIRGKMLQVLNSYLQGRKQYVKNGNVESIILDVLIGVPQGSILGPLLFIIYFNDIVKCSKLSAVLFADDAVFVTQSKSIKLLQRFINHEINLVHEWLVANKLTINLSKTKYIIFHITNMMIGLKNK